MKLLRSVLALVAATGFTLATAALPAVAADPTPAAPKKLFTISDSRLKESSGLAKSAKYEKLYWTVNDSGDTARVFGIDTSGDVKVTLRLKAEVQDVEAIGVDREGTIYIADIGDNKKSRDMIEIYTIPEPDSLTDADNVRYHRYDFKYPDGAHDAETLLVEPESQQLYIVTKSTKGGAIYAAPASPSREGTNRLTKVGPAPAGTFTDGTFLPDGKHVVLLTYTDVSTVAWGEKPTLAARASIPIRQSESVAVGADDTVLVGSEGSNSAVYQVQIPVKKGAATPPASSAPPKGGANTADTGANASDKNHNLRWIIIGAALFALVITVLTFPPGRRERLDRMAENARLTGQSATPSRRRHSA
ncbi:hypothetical protein E1263_41870 [Kribbella antibiotica]|uniref:Esterase-like activity of phytase family protein n=1 Tax=Kribbella antibiotica TaxID=190195 RepID=A0A4R4YGT4_9ACTN|nr:hypothetical protein [Kribbella antibiotica]TDD43119.1 hypothetical protein E1263_41870 [Kribbella antibiotica]